MTLLLTGCPLWVLAILVVVLPSIASAGILVLVRRHVGLAPLITNNEVAGFKLR